MPIPIHIPGVKNPSGPGRVRRSGRSSRHLPPQFEGAPEQLEGQNQGPDPHRQVHPDPLDHVGPIDGPKPARHQVSGGNDQEDESPHLKGNPVPGSHREDVPQSLGLDLDVEDGEEDGDDGDKDSERPSLS